MKIDELPPLVVAARLKAEPKGVYLDVRTEQEFSRGHPAGALNIPIAVLAPGSYLPWPNLKFIKVVRANIDRQAPVYVGCASGHRSLHAAGILAKNGYARVANVEGGFAGKKGHQGGIVQPGWSQLELPVDSGTGGERSYETLLSRVVPG
jgi:rhodanese-related sulfurtransferase